MSRKRRSRSACGSRSVSWERLAPYNRRTMAIETKRRLPPEIFDLPVEKMREGYYSDVYFNHARETLVRDGRHPLVLMQIFQKKQAILGGMDEAIAILKLCSHDWDGLTVRALYDGDPVEPYETVMTIAGDYTLFAHLETAYLGVLARRTLISTNVRRVVEAANGKPILFFPARHDHHRVQTGDGYAAHVAGAIGVSTEAQASWWGGRGIGTVPHALISAYHGDTVLAAERFAEQFQDETNIVVLVDFENDSVRTSLEVAGALGDRLWGVRLDTSRTLVDRSSGTRWATSTPAASTSGSSARCERRLTTRGTGTFGSWSRVASTPSESRSSRLAGSRSTPTASVRR